MDGFRPGPLLDRGPREELPSRSPALTSRWPATSATSRALPARARRRCRCGSRRRGAPTATRTRTAARSRASWPRAAARAATASSRGARSTFDHARTKYPLSGRHARVSCTPCHRRAEPGAAAPALRFAGTPTDLRRLPPRPAPRPVRARRGRLLRALPHDRRPQGVAVRPLARRRVHARRRARPARVRGLPPAGDPRTACGSSATSRSPRRAAAATARARSPRAEDAHETPAGSPDSPRRLPARARAGAATARARGDNPHGDLQIDCGGVPQPGALDARRQAADVPPRRGRGSRSSRRTRRVSCRGCHRSLVFNQVGTACADCHKDAHRGELGLAVRVVPHADDVDEPARDVPGARPVAVSRSSSSHARLDCTACHRGQNPYQYKNTPAECGNCHLSTYLATTNPNHVQGGLLAAVRGLPQRHVADVAAARRSSTRRASRSPAGTPALACARCHTGGSYAGTSRALRVVPPEGLRGGDEPEPRRLRASRSSARTATRSSRGGRRSSTTARRASR